MPVDLHAGRVLVVRVVQLLLHPLGPPPRPACARARLLLWPAPLPPRFGFLLAVAPVVVLIVVNGSIRFSSRIKVMS